MEKIKELMTIIENWENGITNFESTVNQIETLTGKRIDEYSLRNYWTYTTLEDFCETFLIEPIIDWENINDETAKILIKEILDNVGKDGIIIRNEEALEKKYQKPTGFLNNLIFWNDLSEAEILKELQKDTVIYL